MGRSKRSKRTGKKNHDLVNGLRHPLRRAILRLMSDGREASPSELAEELDESLAKVAYHVRVLAECDALKPSGSKKVRGATQHFYSWSMDAEWARAMLDADEEEPPGGKP
jgi:DNA-binding transcriptional ArsR family regulator